ncbi:Hypothetical predicted protein [Paramuricea clavata]|uniref:Uncharacterized protein n=1 Tax=Paramuricea clavata TaxID=317549 RepID=A0A7D9ISM7_PARCT|nr:Hypothetical predicted protein [Paramuricea clavata]
MDKKQRSMDGHGEQTFNYLNKNSVQEKCSRLLGAMLNKSWPLELKEGSQLNDKEKEKILLNHLLTWSTWPGFLKFFGSSSSSKDKLTKQGACRMIMARAESCLDNLIKSVENGNVTVGTLKVLEKHSNQFLKLGEIHQMNRKVSVSVKNYFSQRLRELKEFFTLRDHLECFIRFNDKFTSGISLTNYIFSEYSK